MMWGEGGGKGKEDRQKRCFFYRIGHGRPGFTFFFLLCASRLFGGGGGGGGD